MSAGPRRQPIRVLIAKPGLDGHDVGAKILCRALMDAGMEVLYTGLRQSPEAIAGAAVAEDVDVIGLSVLSGAHLPLCRKLSRQLAAARGDPATQGDDPASRDAPLWIVGGNIPGRDREALSALGVSAVFATGSSLDDIVDYIQERVPR